MRIGLIALGMIGFASHVDALYDPAREYTETPAVTARYPDPAVDIRTPSFAAELASAEGARRLDRVNVLIVPRANPDGAYDFVRGLANGADVNRDHLLASTPEGRALGRVFADYQPDVVLDCHEFGVKIRWL